jgi:hypothetical protein
MSEPLNRQASELEMAEQRELLLIVAHELVESCKRHGVVAHAVLGGQFGQLEVVMTLDAPWCRVSIQNGPGGMAGLRLRSARTDYGADAANQRLTDLASSLSVAGAFGELLATHGSNWTQAAQAFQEHIDADIGPLEPTHPKQ